MCKSVNDVEWSGIIFCKTEGHPIDLSTFKLEPIDILPMHKGEPSYTEFEVDESIIDAYDNNPVLEDCKMGIIHSHIDMNVFFSGTDTSTLHKYAALSNFCISIIVNNAGDITGKVAYLVKNKTKSYLSEYMNEEGDWISSNLEEKEEENNVIVEVPLTFSFELDNLFNDRVETIIKKAKEEQKKATGFMQDGSYKNTYSYKPFTHPSVKSEGSADTKPKYSRYLLLNFLCKILENDPYSLNSGIVQALDKFYKGVLGKGTCTVENIPNWVASKLKNEGGVRYFPTVIPSSEEEAFIEEAMDLLVELSIDNPKNSAILKADKEDVLSELYEGLSNLYYDGFEDEDDDYDFNQVY